MFPTTYANGHKLLFPSWAITFYVCRNTKICDASILWLLWNCAFLPALALHGHEPHRVPGQLGKPFLSMLDVKSSIFSFFCLYGKKTALPFDVYCFKEGSQLFTWFASQTLWQTPSLSFQKNIPSVVQFYPNRWSMLVLSEPSQGGNVEEKRRSGLAMVWPEHTRKHTLCLAWQTYTVEGKFTVYFRQQ